MVYSLVVPRATPFAFQKSRPSSTSGQFPVGTSKLAAGRPLPDEQGIVPHRGVKAPSQSTIYVANRAGTSLIGPYTLQNVAANAGAVTFLGGTNPNTGSYNWGNVPQKLVTFTNNSNNHQTIYPFLYSPNNNKIYDPIDTANDEYRLYIGYQNNGNYILGLPYGKTITIDVPLVFWNGGRADIATDGVDLLPQPNQVQTLNPYQFTYTASTYITQQGVTSSNDNGILMYYKANTVGAPVNPSPAAPGQLTEWTIRDQDFLTTRQCIRSESGVRPNPCQRADNSHQLRCFVCR